MSLQDLIILNEKCEEHEQTIKEQAERIGSLELEVSQYKKIADALGYKIDCGVIIDTRFEYLKNKTDKKG